VTIGLKFDIEQLISYNCSMELAAKLRWSALIVAVITLVIGGSIGVAKIAKSTFSASKKTVVNSKPDFNLLSYNKPGVVLRIEVLGPSVGNESFKSYRIDVTSTYRTVQSLATYNKNIVSEKRYDNNKEAFDTFIKSLGLQRYTKLDPAFTVVDDKGYCSGGLRYYYEVYDQVNRVFHSWGTSCSNKIGTSDATSEVRRLFLDQAPDFANIVDKTLQ
jgi:hypothetical protein